jgi:hypothetical protein
MLFKVVLIVQEFANSYKITEWFLRVETTMVLISVLTGSVIGRCGSCSCVSLISSGGHSNTIAISSEVSAYFTFNIYPLHWHCIKYAVERASEPHEERTRLL